MTTLQSLLQIPTELSPSSNIPISGKQLPLGNECNKTQHCFLCDSLECWVKKNGKVSSEMFILCSRPMDNNQNLSDAKRAACQPFFPFISKLATTLKTKSMSADGTVVVCGVCYYNLMAQWISFENVEKVLEQERWKRKYKHDSFACLVCKQVVHRHETKVMHSRRFTDSTETSFPWIQHQMSWSMYRFAISAATRWNQTTEVKSGRRSNSETILRWARYAR